jgi:RNA polymerase sigma factor for flagellar operon FliA
MEISQLWERCRSGDAEARGMLIERYAPLATAVARRMRVPTGALVGDDDLVSAGFLGLIDAVDRFQPDREVAFEAYASLRIRGAILDELRRVDDRGRAERRRLREAVTAGGEPEISSFTNNLSLDAIMATGDRDWAAEDEVAERHDREDLRMRVEQALTSLPPRQREVLARYYGEALTLRESATRMGISEARACQLHGRAIENLQRHLAVLVARPGMAHAAA